MFKGMVKNNEKLESFIGVNSNFKGDVDTKGTLRIDGSMEGKVNADWVILGEKALVKGDITAKGIVVGGKVERRPPYATRFIGRARGRGVGDPRGA